MKTAIEMARQAWDETGEGWVVPGWFADRQKSFERLAELIRADEREACIKAVASFDDPIAAIRARGQN